MTKRERARRLKQYALDNMTDQTVKVSTEELALLATHYLELEELVLLATQYLGLGDKVLDLVRNAQD
jgi:hypothetical protein